MRETSTDGLDLIFTDIMGLMILAERSGPDYSLHKYKLKNVFIVFRSKDYKSLHCAKRGVTLNVLLGEKFL